MQNCGNLKCFNAHILSDPEKAPCQRPGRKRAPVDLTMDSGAVSPAAALQANVLPAHCDVRTRDLATPQTRSDLATPQTGSDLTTPQTGSDLATPQTGSDLATPCRSLADLTASMTLTAASLEKQPG